MGSHDGDDQWDSLLPPREFVNECTAERSHNEFAQARALRPVLTLCFDGFVFTSVFIYYCRLSRFVFVFIPLISCFIIKASNECHACETFQNTSSFIQTCRLDVYFILRSRSILIDETTEK